MAELTKTKREALEDLAKWEVVCKKLGYVPNTFEELEAMAACLETL